MRTYLNHDWLFAKGKDDSFLSKKAVGETVEIPHCPVLLPIQYFDEKSYQGLWSYRKEFDAPNDLPNQFLVFEGAMLQFDCYLNGELLGHFVSGFLPVRIDVSGKLKEKGNVLVVYLDSREDPLIPPFGKVVDYLTFAGIYREVYLDSRPKAYIEDYFVRADSNGHIKVDVETKGEATLSCELTYEGEQIASFVKEITVPNNRLHLYSPEFPCLYDLVISYGEDKIETKVGFRDASWKEDGFYLNGTKTKLLGLNRHQSYPYFGMAAPRSLQIEDAELLKASGINVVRTSHYPQDESFLDACDRLGLLLIDEIPGWQFISKEPKWRENCLDFARRMILKERNHPCLIAYGLRIDESADDHELYSSIQALKKELDPYRPSLGVRNFKESECLEDIYAYNDFSCSDLTHGADKGASWKGAEGKPKLVSEHNGHMFPTKSFDSTARRSEHALRHAKVISDVNGDPDIAGAIGWCAFDYNTHREFGCNDHICHHGVYDIFRNPKEAAYLYASQGKEGVLEAASSFLSGDYDEALLPPAYVFTDADRVELRKNGVRIGDFYPDKEDFPNMVHPPIKVDDWIGETFDEPRYSEKDAKKMVAALNYAAQFGFSRIHFSHKVLMLKAMLKYHLTFTDIYNTYGKYISSWGSENTVWSLTAYKGDKEVGHIEKGPSLCFHLEVKAARTTLIHGDRYDCVRVSIAKLDQNGNLCRFASDPIEVKAEGPIEVYGPSLFSLYGGQSAVFVRTKAVKKPTKAKLILKGRDEEKTIEFEVK